MSEVSAGSTLVFIVGPPAVGKMTVGHELALRTELKLFHNHQTIELVLPFFPFGTPPFNRLVREFRRRIFEEVAASDLAGMIFTYVWEFGNPAEAAAVDEFAAIFDARGSRVLYVELEASQAERLRRNETAFRLAAKPSKRDVERSRRMLLEHDAAYKLNSTDELVGRPDYLRIDNTTLGAAEAAERIIEHFGLTRATHRST